MARRKISRKKPTTIKVVGVKRSPFAAPGEVVEVRASRQVDHYLANGVLRKAD